MAILSFSVVKQAETAAAALTENSKALADVLKALKEAAIEDRDLQTSNFSVQPLYKHYEPKDGVYVAPEITGYQVSNGLTVRVRDLKKLGAILIHPSSSASTRAAISPSPMTSPKRR